MESILSEHDGVENETFRDFDSLFDTKALRIMRVLIPFFPVHYQPFLVIWVRFSQLQYAVSLLKDDRFRSGRTRRAFQAAPGTPDEQLLTRLLCALKPCLSESEYRELTRMQNMFSMFRRFQQIAPYLSALSSMSGDASAADMINLFSAMQGGDNSAADIMNAFSSGSGGSSTADMINAFSAMQDAGNSTENTTAGMRASSSAQEADNSSEAQNTGAGMNLDRILDLISLFQTSSAEADTNTNTTERQEEQES